MALLVGFTLSQQETVLLIDVHTDVVFTDVHTDVVLAHLGLIRSHDHDNNDAHIRVPVYPKSKMAAGKLQSFVSLFSQIFLEYAISMSNRGF